ncbi:13683_t:CDS:2, partial [Gigaspora rosea]
TWIRERSYSQRLRHICAVWKRFALKVVELESKSTLVAIILFNGDDEQMETKQTYAMIVIKKCIKRLMWLPNLSRNMNGVGLNAMSIRDKWLKNRVDEILNQAVVHTQMVLSDVEFYKRLYLDREIR